MRGTRVKAIRKKMRRAHKNTRSHITKYFRGENGMIIADRDRRTYQMMKKQVA